MQEISQRRSPLLATEQRSIPTPERVALIRRRAQQGDANAQYELAEAHWYGQGVLTDYKASFKYYSMAAEQGHPKAQMGLSRLYYFGDGVRKNDMMAYAWSNVAITLLGESATSSDISHRSNARRSLSNRQIHQAQRISREILERINQRTRK